MIGLATAAGLGLAVLVVLVTLLWLISLRLRDASIVDVFWGLGFVALNLVHVLLTPDGTPARKVTATVLVSLWGIRLAAHLLARNRRRPEDFRYAFGANKPAPPGGGGATSRSSFCKAC